MVLACSQPQAVAGRNAHHADEADDGHQDRQVVAQIRYGIYSTIPYIFFPS
jgi:hypothetical protein